MQLHGIYGLVPPRSDVGKRDKGYSVFSHDTGIEEYTWFYVLEMCEKVSARVHDRQMAFSESECAKGYCKPVYAITLYVHGTMRSIYTHYKLLPR